ncbi:(deoxy)nucleoside triphosphate pyrophosphohydrolase [Kurthia sibirica]|uniref:8-oxo-dGTP diphosphatase n=1 Tax=Kurthia sibirica TaxID=202750 RepID=A0A2U3ANZ6_9BACL|nr:(deoxy)nucleoside triphosphate pyrophosphohydrolase [Kurthia sibirica]PWI26273.1 8-oxo-dGTP diphosphatase MutT [Kurthia sibirica]GEK33888.1 DNA mismatch repair protein MutT [Kurthia sibirica]
MKKKIHVVGAIIKNSKNEIFAAQRNLKMTLGGYWEFPGGKIEIGETSKIALVREIQEEFNCLINVYEKVEDTIYEYENFIVRLETYMAEIKKGELNLLEHSDSIWLKKKDLMILDWAPADIPAVRKIMETMD